MTTTDAAARPTSAVDPSGIDADSPWAMPLSAWKAVLLRSWREANKDNVGLVAAGVAFYGFLALVPLLGAVVLSYGLVAEPETVIRNVRALTTVMPPDAALLVGEQLMTVIETSGTKKGLGVLLALGLALFGARNGAGAIMTALNIAYEEEEKRGFVMANLTALGITAGGVVVAILAVVAIAALGHLDVLWPHASGALLAIGKVLTYLLLVLGGAAGAATLYRYGPSREKPRWVWLTPGSLLTALLWMGLTIGFGLYVSNFGNYNATYGSLGAVVVLLTWLYLSSYILLLGAELNSELEHQTARDTTDGAAAPLGERGAWAADHVAGEANAAPVSSEAAAGAPPPAPRPSVETLALNRGAVPAGWAAARLLGAGRAGWLTSGAALIGLSLLRQNGKAAAGASLIGSAAVLAWLRREGVSPAARPECRAAERPSPSSRRA